MPIVSIPEKVLFEKLGRSYTEQEFDDLCFAYGLELDEITSEQELAAREHGIAVDSDRSSETIYKVEVPANRYDLLCAEGLARALLIFQNKLVTPEYEAIAPKNPIRLMATESVKLVRPYVVCAVLRDIKFDERRYASFIDLQDKLHQNIGRKRSLVAIGTHDLDTLAPPFIYTALPPGDIRFRPLNQTKEYTAVELMQLYSNESHLKAYLDIIRDKPVYSLIKDSKGTVLSMPPIINGEHSKITLATKNVFIECTATDLNKASIVVDTIVTMFSEYCARPFTAEQVEVTQWDGSCAYYPRLQRRTALVGMKYINTLVGIDCSETEVTQLLTRMSLTSCVANKDVHISTDKACNRSSVLSVRIPPTRQDILHPCDIAEDVAIAYGYDRVEENLPTTFTMVIEQPLNRLTDMIRAEVALCGFTEALTFSLCSRADISTNLQKRLEDQPAVHISNPKTLDFQASLLSTLSNNRSLPLPLKLFEVQDVVLKDPSKDVGCRNNRRVCAVYSNKTSGFEVVHGLLDRLMHVLEVAYEENAKTDGLAYRMKEVDDPTYFRGRCADIILLPSGQSIGRLGVVHPNVLRNFDLSLCVSAFEIDIEPFL
ncbi:Phenylalanyl-tRNA synthetase beta chain [Echinococcus granulosus]|uniref:Phenylalanine--tRNA ligase beta subunit n=1 Tax=Echinococcus granulosus TaxID=6210 RepID=W6UZW7_ECHGR|nr:Phenylalanyl-tRNA synthetase beta chain [Echinococcus granulosus]EUB64102.1 Phenylalanyl-tRNA synthetase beta chain [Echinococcus granulosus]